MSKLEELLDVSKSDVEKGLELHRKYIVCDSLANDPIPKSKSMIKKMNEMLDAGKSYRDVGVAFRMTHPKEYLGDPEAYREYVDAWKSSGVTCMNNSMKWYGGLLKAIESISHCDNKIDKWSDILIKATKADDIRRAKKEGKFALMMGFQSATFIGGGDSREAAEQALDNLELVYGLGVRIIQLTYNIRNLAGDGCFERRDAGLSHFGLQLVDKMNEIGMLVDISHSGTQTTLDAVEASRVPIAATHTSCNGLYDIPRGKTDEELLAIAEKDGYIGITGVILAGNILKTFDHIDYAVDLVGADKVGIGSDVGYYSPKTKRLSDKEAEEGYMTRADGYERSAAHRESHLRTHDEKRTGSLAWVNWPYHTIGLVSKGYSDQEIQKIIGGNFLRILEKIIG